MRKAVLMAGGIAVVVPAGLAYAALLGLGIHRHAAPWVVSASATFLLFAPPFAVAIAHRKDRSERLLSTLFAWSIALLILLPVYFPGERRAAVSTGLSLLGTNQNWEFVARSVADNLPSEPQLATPELPEAKPVSTKPIPTRTVSLSDREIALPYEGDGRRISVPVVFEHGDRTVEVYMLLDTGATYTTLPASVLRTLGIDPGANAPEIQLQTANGIRTANIHLTDRVWLGNLDIEGVAIATCEECAFKDTDGLLGLNVTGGFNVSIDADLQEVIFEARTEHDRHLDVKHFTEIGATFTPYPGGRIEIDVALDNRAGRDIASATAAVHCNDQRWTVPLTDIPVDSFATARRRLPDHPRCDQYEISLQSARW